MDILAVIRADAVRQRRAHVVHAAERRQLDGEAVCARALSRKGSPQTSVIKDPVAVNVEPLIARTYGAIPPSLPFSHYRFAERARRFGRHDRLAKQLHKVIDTSGAVPHLSDAAVSELECGETCPIK